MNDGTKIEYGYLSINHKGEELCGDHVQVAKGDDGSLTLVLADGIGSGVVASILSTLTSAMLARMVQGGIPLEDCVSSLVETLPLARDRGNVAYCTFTIVKIDRDYLTTIYNFDNPEPVFLRDGKLLELPYQELEIGGKKINKT
ncbi:MAG: SpoIIE family protein phosphatase, partial [Bacilli bacterium]|nr:SpoIIE family protein phosphatase [Bacilli bacterium]